ncbi:MAG TPA: hypothetical protein VEA40_25500 [Ramlibacter sp.]|nr:hypothetical protein [Ramlibacter sp.]
MLRVECAPSPDTGHAEPVLLWFGNRPVPVRSVVDRWWGPGQRWWKVETAEGAYIVRLDQASGQWELAAVVGE